MSPMYRNVTKGWAISAPGANTDALPSDVTWPSDRACRISIQVATSTVVNLMVTRGATEKALGLNSNTALTAGAVHTFDVYGMEKDDSVQVQVETDSAIDMVSLEEIW